VRLLVLKNTGAKLIVLHRDAKDGHGNKPYRLAKRMMLRT
jgi:hypothetical protein